MKELKPIKRRRRPEAKNRGRIEFLTEPDREKTRANSTRRKETGENDPEKDKATVPVFSTPKENQQIRMPETELPITPIKIASAFERPIAETRAEVPMELQLINPNESPSKINAVPNEALIKAGKKRKGANDVETKVFKTC